MKRTIISTLIYLAAFTGLVSCDVNPVSLSGGKQIDAESLENSAVSLRSVRSTDNVVYCLLTEGGGFTVEGIRGTINTPSSFDQTIVLEADPSLVEAYSEEQGMEYQPFPTAFYSFENGGSFCIPAGESSSEITRITFSATNKLDNRVKAGRYVLPVVAKASAEDVSRNVIYFDIVVREPFEGDAELYTGEDFFFVFYLNTSDYDPRLVTDYYLLKDSNQNDGWYNGIGNILNLRKTTVSYDENTGRALFTLSSDMKYVLDHYSKYILPIRETGRKVCLSIEGGGSGLGFCNMTDIQIEDFVDQVKLVFDNYELDGINLWDRNTEYGKEGTSFPPMNTTSYPKLIKALREMLGPDKLLTIADYEEPTEYFWDLDAMGGISVGEYLDYAWSGYCDIKEYTQVIDPYNPDAPGVSQIHPRKPIHGLDASKYGCVNAPWQPRLTPETITLWDDSMEKISDWVLAGHKKNNIIVLEDLMTSLQNNYEGAWESLFVLAYLDENSLVYKRRGNTYLFDKGKISSFDSVYSGYGKWLKDW